MLAKRIVTGTIVAVALSLAAAGVLSAAAPVQAPAAMRVCMHDMNPCNTADCQTWCELNYDPNSFGTCSSSTCCNCFL